ncbi:CAAX prenyl protease 1 homolog [Drosophila novamexicana]|uniref:CAAX prenyl protease 1 homolog n=1 Tax=Drosophila novamexicana TaxID=47314 RepID=UPI0011E6040F|nr:CAAX prenyl protease 1 homolog [Drosophila novamexicana]
MSHSLYQDPMQSQPMVIPDTGIHLRLLPKDISLFDPVLLRHMLCLMIVVRNFFHVYLCWRQLRVCNKNVDPPPEMQNAFTKEAYVASKTDEMYSVEQSLLSYIFDTIFCFIELYFGVYPYLWRVIINCYSIVDDLVWQSIAYVGLFSSYLVLRHLPQIFYNKLVLAQWYNLGRDKTLPLVGVLCSFALLLVLVQVGLVPLTAIFLFIERSGGTFFVLWIWGFLFIVTSLGLMTYSFFGIPFLSKRSKLPAGELKDALAKVLKIFRFKADHVYLIHTNFQLSGSKANAWGCSCWKRIFIMENLLLNLGKPESELYEDEIGKGLNTQEMVGYIAHALVHWRQWHIVKSFIMVHVTLIVYFMIFGVCYRLHCLYEAAGFSPGFYPPIVGYWLVYKYVMPIYLTITNWIIFFVLHSFEYSADKYTWKLGYGSPLVAALLKIFADNPVFPYVDRWYMMWHRFRPTYLLRIKRIAAWRAV